MNTSFHVGDLEENVIRNRDLFCRSLGITRREIAVPGQVHSAIVRRVDRPGEVPECDALVTSTPRVFLSISVADCVPILLCDPRVQTVAAVHAGWRGTATGILTRVIKQMCSDFGATPEGIIAYLGPAASSCCYYVGEEVASQFDSRFVLRGEKGTIVDLKGANVRQLLDSGIRESQIEVSPSCTISESALFHSFRRDGARSGRMMAVIGIIR
jgi:YfiH family protein